MVAAGAVTGKVPAMPTLSAPVTAVWGVGEERARILARLDIFTVEDLLLHRPRRYEDRQKFLSIKELQLGEAATVRGKIVAAGIKRFRKGTRSMFECVFEDGTARLHCRWWQAQGWMPDWFAVGREFLVFGKPGSLKPRTIDHPETELVEPGDDEFIHVNRIVPVHPLTEGLTARVMRTLVWRALEQFVAAPQRQSANFPEWRVFDERLRGIRRDRLPSRANAVRMVHFPEALPEVELARQRLALDEFVVLQTQIQIAPEKIRGQRPGPALRRRQSPDEAVSGGARFQTHRRARPRCCAKSARTWAGVHPDAAVVAGRCRVRQDGGGGLRRDDDAGKRFQRGADGPDGNLGGTAFSQFFQMVRPAGREDRAANRQPQDGGRPVRHACGPRRVCFIGTHALLTSGFELPKLGLVIIDEQHKFGVTQRETLVRKGNYPAFAGDDGHADPAHAGPDPLRRSGRVGDG